MILLVALGVEVNYQIHILLDPVPSSVFLEKGQIRQTPINSKDTRGAGNRVPILRSWIIEYRVVQP